MTARIGKPAALLALCLLAVASVALQGCREEEQGRILLYDKGTYLGQPDTSLSADTLDDLRRRALEVQGY